MLTSKKVERSQVISQRKGFGHAKIVQATGGGVTQSLVFFEGHLIKVVGSDEPQFIVRDGQVYHRTFTGDDNNPVKDVIATLRNGGTIRFCFLHRCEAGGCKCNLQEA